MKKAQFSLTGSTFGIPSTTDYCRNIIYKDGELSMILTPEGYITKNGGVYAHHYYLKDHLGNNRVVLSQGNEVEETTDYYPFGMPWLSVACKNDAREFGEASSLRRG
jgi:hypothetical protein